MAVSLTPVLIFLLVAWTPWAVLTTMGSRRWGESFGRALGYGIGFPATWVAWLVHDNHAAGRRAFRSR